MQYQSATAIELRECGELSHVGPQLYRSLKKLVKAGWIQETSKKPKVFSLSDKSFWQLHLDAIITATQNRMTEQKNAYHALVSAISDEKSIAKNESSKAKRSSKEKKTGSIIIEHSMAISEKFPGFIQAFASAFYTKSGWQIVKSEPNISIMLKKEDIAFNLSSIQWKTNENVNAAFGGIYFYEALDTPARDQLINRVNTYTLETMNFNYKMEKTYREKNKRSLLSFSIEPTDNKDLLTANLHLELENEKLDGKVQIMLHPKDNWIIAVWAETIPIFEEIVGFIQNYSWEN